MITLMQKPGFAILLELLFSLAAVLPLAGCTPPVLSSAIMQKVDRSIGFEELRQNPEKFRGKTVLLAGDIIETKNWADRTAITLLARNADSFDRPINENLSLGRFILIQPGFLDPAIYRPGREITAAGVVVGREMRPLGEIDYSYPVIENRELYLWPEEEHHRREPAVHFGVGIGIGF